MTFPHTFANLAAGNQPASFLDDNFNASVWWAVAGGTSDVITASYTPAVTTLSDGLHLGVRFTAANGTTTPTFAPDSNPAHPITKKGGSALAVGDIPGNLSEGILAYNLANTRWELLNPAAAASSSTSGSVYNGLINGGMEFWQRSTGIAAATIAVGASANGYGPDRWALTTGANQACTMTIIAGLTNGSQLGAQVQRNNGQTGLGTLVFEQPFELPEIIKWRGQTISVSLTLATGALWSPTNGTLTLAIACGTGAAARRGNSAYTGETQPLSSGVNIAAATSAATYTATASAIIPTTTTQMTLMLTWVPTGTAGATDYFQIDDVMFSTVIGAAYERRITQQELAMCQRYYAKSYALATAPGTAATTTNQISAFDYSTTGFLAEAYLPVTMRTAPTSVVYSPNTGTAGKVYDLTGAADVSVSGGNAYTNLIDIRATLGGTGHEGNAHFAASAEL